MNTGQTENKLKTVTLFSRISLVCLLIVILLIPLIVFLAHKSKNDNIIFYIVLSGPIFLFISLMAIIIAFFFKPNWNEIIIISSQFIALIIIALAYMFFLGIFNGERGPEKCVISPGINCIDFTAKIYTEKQNQNNNQYYIILVLQNDIGTDVLNLSISIVSCNQTIINSLPLFAINTQETININCPGIKKGEKFKSNLVTTYDTYDGEILNHHSKKGYIVVSPQ